MQTTESRTYTVADPAALAAKIKAEGGPAIDPTQPTGKAIYKGVDVMWTMAEGENGSDNIMITILSKPWEDPYSLIWSKIDAVLS